ncbi:MAG: sigma 54-interacting transcriptional regulator, partial [Candidatus Deferrimicrobium sp.]
REEYGDLPVILMTAYGSIRTAVDAMKAGAQDYLLKPFEPDEILLHIHRILEIQDLRAADRFRTARNQETFDLRKTLVFESPAMRRIQREMTGVLNLDTTILLTGETGTGKQLIARAIHYNGPRRDGPLIEVNCAAIPETLFETELFGHARGAFTGAVADRKGMFQLAHGGTLFLDEIGEMPLSLQPKLLTAIQEKKFLRVGGTRQIDVDVRIIAATNKSMEEEVAAGTIRRPPGPRGLLPPAVRPQMWKRDRPPVGGRRLRAPRVRLAGQRAGTGEFHRTRRHPGGGGSGRDRLDAGPIDPGAGR